MTLKKVSSGERLKPTQIDSAFDEFGDLIFPGTAVLYYAMPLVIRKRSACLRKEKSEWIDSITMEVILQDVSFGARKLKQARTGPLKSCELFGLDAKTHRHGDGPVLFVGTWANARPASIMAHCFSNVV